ncbi:aspartate/glutamate racemase family protein [Chloroflexota bacterium]
MSKICLITSAEGPRLRPRQAIFEILKEKKAIRPDTEIGIKTLAKHTTTLRPYADTLYFELLQTQYVVEGVIQAEKEGYDAAVIGCYFDPGLDAAREVANIPVVGIAEGSISIALLLTKKKGSIAVMAVAPKGVPKTFDVLDKYGFSSHLIPIRPVRQIPMEVYVAAGSGHDVAAIKTAKDEFIKVSRECIRDGAELVIIGCGGLGPLLASEGLTEVDGVPILDSVTCAIKMAENLIDLKKIGISVSRYSMYRQPLPEDFEKERGTFGFS